MKLIGEFYDTLASLRGRKEIRLFLKDLLSPDEIAMLHRRVQVALLLEAGMTFDEIAAKLRTGKDKVANVKKALERDGRGYRMVIKRLKKLKVKRLKAVKTKQRGDRGMLRLKSRYPGAFLLFNLFDEIEDYLSAKKEVEENPLK